MDILSIDFSLKVIAFTLFASFLLRAQALLKEREDVAWLTGAKGTEWGIRILRFLMYTLIGVCFGGATANILWLLWI
jgi:uncharacterized membrane protein